MEKFHRGSSPLWDLLTQTQLIGIDRISASDHFSPSASRRGGVNSPAINTSPGARVMFLRSHIIFNPVRAENSSAVDSCPTQDSQGWEFSRSITSDKVIACAKTSNPSPGERIEFGIVDMIFIMRRVSEKQNSPQTIAPALNGVAGLPVRSRYYCIPKKDKTFVLFMRYFFSHSSPRPS